ncbi:DUF427 domain-containing protein [Streptomyces marincola]|uniref:DUF427 domain-containing protein n=1 Tax=Streptomyces marincola TaxID=2878388 RepID=A0A1W7CUX2_9ACTN|nr:DUF427 domain-containing protein [Streptomyces marincola]ARQ68542.1 hypothetical protein CAG99_06445 [Streptomyces marincola]
MTLTLSHGPLSAAPPPTVNYRVTGPAHRLFWHPFPRRVRALVGGETVLDTRGGHLLHETGLLPQLYVPTADVRSHLLRPSDHGTHCPFKGDAAYWSVHAGGRVVEDAVWAYPEPVEGAEWLRGYQALYWSAADAWFDEEEQVHGHLRDPYHRVDVRRSGSTVRVLLDGTPVAETSRPVLLSETGLPNRWYVPPEDVRLDLLTGSATRTVCPYKGTAHYWSFTGGAAGGVVDDVAWSYPEPLEEATRAAGFLCFDHERVTTEVDGRPVGPTRPAS